MATFWERAAHSVTHTFSLLCPFLLLVVFHLDFKGENLVLIAPVSGNCFPFTFFLAGTMQIRFTSCSSLHLISATGTPQRFLCSNVQPSFII